MGTGGGERREGNKSEERRCEFMFRTHGNLWAANWRGGKMGNGDGTRCEGMYGEQLLGLIPG